MLADAYGIFAWGWNNEGAGFGEHAEAAALRRANRSRLAGATLYVAARRKRNHKAVLAKPCPLCRPLTRSVGRVIFRDEHNTWLTL